VQLLARAYLGRAGKRWPFDARAGLR